MNTLVVYFSKFGHTARVAEAVAAGLDCGARLLSAEQLSDEDLESIDLLIMGSPTHKMNLPEAVIPLFDRFPRRALRGKQIAAFDTSYELSRWLQPFTAGKRIDRRLRKLGGERVSLPETFIVEGREGPLHLGELERATAWGEAIRRRLAVENGAAALS